MSNCKATIANYMVSVTQATLKTKFVSCPAGGHNCGQSGGRKIFFFFFFFPLYRNGRKNAGKKKIK